MRKLIAIIMLLGLAALIIGCGDDGEQPATGDSAKDTPAKTTQHEDPHGGFCMDVPEGWEFPDCRPTSEEMSTSATKSKSIIEIKIRETQGTTLDDALKNETKNIDKIKSLKTDNGNIAGADARYCEIVFEDGSDKVEMSGVCWLAIKDGYLYRLQLACPPSEFEASKKDFDIIAKSFKIQDDPTIISEAEAQELAEKAKGKDTTEKPAAGDGGETTEVELEEGVDGFGGYKCKLPKTWFFSTDKHETDLLSAKATNDYKGHITIEITPLGNKTLDGVVEDAIAEKAADKVAEKKRRIDGLDAKGCEFTFKDDDKELAGAFWAMKRHGNLYCFKLTCPEADFEKCNEALTIMLDTFDIQVEPEYLKESDLPPDDTTEKPATAKDLPFEVADMVSLPYYLGDHVVEFQTQVPGNWQIGKPKEADAYQFHIFSPQDKDGQVANCHIYVVPRDSKNMQEWVALAKEELKELKTNFKYIKGETLKADHHECHLMYTSETIGGKKHLAVGGLYLGERYVYYIEIVYTEKNFPAAKDTLEKMVRSFKLTKEGDLDAPEDNGGNDNAKPDKDKGGDDGQDDGWDDDAEDGGKDDGKNDGDDGWDDDEEEGWDDEGE